MVVIGIDPGTRSMGWAVIEKQDRALILRECGAISSSSRSVSHRLVHIHKELSTIMEQFKPSCLVIEKVFVAKNPASALTLGYARGIAMMTAALYESDIQEYAATTVKQRLTGYGHASKEQMVAMIERLFRVSLQHDKADAVALAFCHCQNNVLE